MLVINKKINDGISLDGNIIIKVLKVTKNGKVVKLGIETKDGTKIPDLKFKLD